MLWHRFDQIWTLGLDSTVGQSWYIFTFGQYCKYQNLCCVVTLTLPSCKLNIQLITHVLT